jgi:aspartate carbamoyltransferase regulatory subunit
MAEEQQLVRRIKNGTVLDHIEQGSALKVLEALNVTGDNGNIVAVAMNVESKRYGKKDIIKVENKFLEPSETNRIALISPKASVNIIKDYKIVEKRNIEIPESFVNVFKCPNPTCVSNAREPLEPVIDIVKKDPVVLRCKYCRRLFATNDLLV